MITTAVNVGSTPISFWTIEKFGRRMLLIYGAAGMLVCEFLIAIVGTVSEGSDAASKCLIVFTCLYIFFFASTWGPGAWVGMSHKSALLTKLITNSDWRNISSAHSCKGCRSLYWYVYQDMLLEITLKSC